MEASHSCVIVLRFGPGLVGSCPEPCVNPQSVRQGRGDRAVESPKPKVFNNWTSFEVVTLEWQGAHRKYGVPQACGSRLSANMENDEDS